MMELIEPSTEYKNSFIEAVKEYKEDTVDSFRHAKYRELSLPELEADFGGFVARELGKSEGENLPEGYVPQTDYWLVDGSEFIGRVSIRHSLTEHLRQLGGHIGYDIRPSKRRKGYGTKILQLALPKARELGIERVLVTCDAGNAASQKIIEKNGGVLENQVSDPETGGSKMRFWIDPSDHPNTSHFS
ncbi:MAG: GNAT family N-acetyltransferase [Patescibacteria group bacterium]|nr:GNAT family N-acetyltransferase [Patescibacteria group bacterium]